MSPFLWLEYIAATGAGLFVIFLAVVLALGLFGWLIAGTRPRS